MSRKPVFALSLFLIFFCGPRAYSQETEGPAMPGAYYFKGIGLLEIRAEGDGVVAETSAERGMWKLFLPPPGADASGAQANLLQKMAQYRHRGKLTGPQSIDFGDFDVTFESLLQHFGLSENDLPPDKRATVREKLGGKNLGHYFERWNLLPNGGLQIDAAVPVCILFPAPGAREETAKTQRFIAAVNEAMKAPGGTNRDVLTEFREANPEMCKRVCGWKITHVGEIEGWKALEAEQYAQAVGLFQQAAQAQPTRPFPCFGEAWARIGARQFDPARQALQAGVNRLTPETRPFLEQLVFVIRDQIYSYETRTLGENSDYLALAETFPSKWPLETRKQDTVRKFSGRKARAIKLEEYDELKAAVAAFPLWPDVQKAVNMRGRGPLLPLGPKAFSPEVRAAAKPPNLLEQQIIAGMVVFSGHLWRAQGNYQNTIYQYVTAVRLGQIMRRGTLVSHMVGLGMEDLGVSALLDLFEDGMVKDGQTLQSMTQMVEFLDKNEPRPEPGELFAYEMIGTMVTGDPVLECLLAAQTVPDFPALTVRQPVFAARFAVLKATCALKRQCLVAPFPEKLDPTLLPEDPFAPGQKIGYVYRKDEERATLYSIGPDARDQGSTIRYDPTNGTSSAGDIYLRTL